jgi:aromatic ring-opening dioxygenase LigB subunit
LPVDRAFADGIGSVSARRALRTISIANSSLDHGATVPLLFVAEAGWRGPIVVVGLSSLDLTNFVMLGETIAEAAASFGFDPRGPEFDRCLIDTLRCGEYRDLLEFDPEIEKKSAQDALDSVLVGLGCGRLFRQWRSSQL